VTARTLAIRDLLRMPIGAAGLAAIDPGDTHGVKRKRADERLPRLHAELSELQERLWAEQRRSVLVVLQGMDTSGKDGTIEHVMSGLNPQGVHVHAFKQPTPQELRHDFLWRVRRQAPGPGVVGIFNRSHYEDVLIGRVEALAPPAEIERRYGAINRFEAELSRTGMRLVKVFLHISFEEQRERLVARLEDPTRHWKFDPADIDKRTQWDDYRAAYDLALERCSTPDVPWYVVPADAKWFRNYAISHLLVETLREMDPKYPQPALDVPRLLARLQPAEWSAAQVRVGSSLPEEKTLPPRGGGGPATDRRGLGQTSTG
jgi:PPK2 family polyphosphate:nucleotide phosphotransferase